MTSEFEEIAKAIVNNDFLDKSFVGVGLFVDDTIRYANESLEKIFGYPLKEIQQTGFWRKAVHPEDIKMFREMFDKRLSGIKKTTTVEYNFRIKPKSGRFKWCKAIAKGFDFYDDLGVVFLVAESEDSIGLNLKFFLEEQSVIGILIIQNDKIKYANQQLSEITGYSINELMQINVSNRSKVVLPVYSEKIDAEIDLLFKGKVQSMNFTIPLVHKNGDNIWIHVYGKIINFMEEPAIYAIVIKIPDNMIQQLNSKAPNDDNKLMIKINIPEICLPFLHYLKDNFGLNLQDYLQKIINDELFSRMEDLNLI